MYSAGVHTVMLCSCSWEVVLMNQRLHVNSLATNVVNVHDRNVTVHGWHEEKVLKNNRTSFISVHVPCFS